MLPYWDPRLLAPWPDTSRGHIILTLTLPYPNNAVQQVYILKSLVCLDQGLNPYGIGCLPKQETDALLIRPYLLVFPSCKGYVGARVSHHVCQTQLDQLNILVRLVANSTFITIYEMREGNFSHHIWSFGWNECHVRVVQYSRLVCNRRQCMGLASNVNATP